MDPFLATYDDSSGSGRCLDVGSLLDDAHSRTQNESFSSLFAADTTDQKKQILDRESSFCNSDISTSSHYAQSHGGEHSRSGFDIPDYVLEEAAASLPDKRRPPNLCRSGSRVVPGSTDDSFALSETSTRKFRPSLMRKASQRAVSTFKSVTGISTRNLRSGEEKPCEQNENKKEVQYLSGSGPNDRWAPETNDAKKDSLSRRGVLSHSDISTSLGYAQSHGGENSESSFDIPDYLLEGEAASLPDKQLPQNLCRSSSRVVSGSTDGSFALSETNTRKSRPSLMRKASQRAASTFKSVAGISTRNLRSGEEKPCEQNENKKEVQSLSGSGPNDRWAPETDNAKKDSSSRRGLLSRMGSRMSVHHDGSKQDAVKISLRPSLAKSASERFNKSCLGSKSRAQAEPNDTLACYSALVDDNSVNSIEEKASHFSGSKPGMSPGTPLGEKSSSDQSPCNATGEDNAPVLAQFTVNLPFQAGHAEISCDAKGFEDENLEHSVDMSDNIGENAGSAGSTYRESRRKPTHAVSKRTTRRTCSNSRLERATHRKLRCEENQLNKDGGMEEEKRKERKARSRVAPTRSFSSTKESYRSNGKGSASQGSGIRRAASHSLVELALVAESQKIKHKDNSKGDGTSCRSSHGREISRQSSRHRHGHRKSKDETTTRTKCQGDVGHPSRGDAISPKSRGASESTRATPIRSDTSQPQSRGASGLPAHHSSRGSDKARHSSRSGERKHHHSERSEKKRRQKSTVPANKSEHPCNELSTSQSSQTTGDLITRIAIVAQSA